MNIKLHTSDSRGGGDFNWLKTRHSFSFGNYFDKNKMGFGVLRVLNDDWIAPGSGFPDHSHQDMEIFTIPLSGFLRHQDSTNKESIITKGDIQIMSAGVGVTHSEFNDSFTEPVELLQIWIAPNVKHLAPRHEDRFFPYLETKNILHTIITPDGNNETLKIHQDAYVVLGTYTTETKVNYQVHTPKHGIFLFVIEGDVLVDTTNLKRRDAVEITDTNEVSMTVSPESFILLIEVPLT